jgi:hypothetical protein
MRGVTDEVLQSGAKPQEIAVFNILFVWSESTLWSRRARSRSGCIALLSSLSLLFGIPDFVHALGEWFSSLQGRGER